MTTEKEIGSFRQMRFGDDATERLHESKVQAAASAFEYSVAPGFVVTVASGARHPGEQVTEGDFGDDSRAVNRLQRLVDKRVVTHRPRPSEGAT